VALEEDLIYGVTVCEGLGMCDGHLPLLLCHELELGTHRPAGAARMSVGEWRCLLVARLKVCSVAERGPGGGRTSSSWYARGVEDGGQVACGWRGLAALA